jgi:cellulose synthase/poly-beta-1,6-N-acetylglucosamine synthase-like glycosyltransferase
MQLDLLYWFRQRKQSVLPAITDYPKVTIQLPLYNEQFVVDRLIDNIVLLD